MTTMPTGRLMSLDAFRGISIAAMILVNDPGSWDHVYPQLLHAEWIGLTFTDFIFPAFLFIVGVSMWFSFKKYAVESRPVIWRMSLIRATLIFLIGLFISWFPFSNLSIDNLHFAGVLQRIAASYVIAVLVCTCFGTRMIAVTAALLLLGYWVFISQIGESGTYERDVFFSQGIDHISFLSLPASAVSIICGYLVGSYIDREEYDLRMLGVLITTGVTLMLIALLWSLELPMIKSLLWSSSYVLFTAGTSIIAFSICFYLIDMMAIQSWAYPFVHFGLNPLFIYVLSIMLDKLTWTFNIGSSDSSVPVHTWIHETIFRPLAGDINGSLMYAVVFVVLHWAIAYGLYRKRIIIKI